VLGEHVEISCSSVVTVIELIPIVAGAVGQGASIVNGEDAITCVTKITWQNRTTNHDSRRMARLTVYIRRDSLIRAGFASPIEKGGSPEGNLEVTLSLCWTIVGCFRSVVNGEVN